MDTEYFVKMKPYIEVETLNKEKWPLYISDFGLGKENIFWKLNIITEHPLNFIFKDKDMFFDDLIGNAILPPNTSVQKEENSTELTLVSTEGDNRKGGNGKVKITTFPIFFEENAEPNILQHENLKINKYILKLGGISKKMEKAFEETSDFEISVGNGFNKYSIFKAKYHQDLLFYIQNKDLEICVDTAFLSRLPQCSIFIKLHSNEQLLVEQIMSIGTT
jgi:hypothetical protein